MHPKLKVLRKYTHFKIQFYKDNVGNIQWLYNNYQNLGLYAITYGIEIDVLRSKCHVIPLHWVLLNAIKPESNRYNILNNKSTNLGLLIQNSYCRGSQPFELQVLVDDRLLKFVETL